MAKIKLTKTELKAQRDALKRFSRYLPTLQLKKQQLQLETRRVRDELNELEEKLQSFRQQLQSWIKIIDKSAADALNESLTVDTWQTGVRNIAGVDTPIFIELNFKSVAIDLFTTPMWLDDAIVAGRKLVEFELRELLLMEQLQALEDELRVTTQRVNLFEKVKIPEARENIRKINIYLGDELASAVGRAKIAKQKARNLEASLS